MKGRLFTILSGVSLVLCVATAVLWLRSYWVDDDIGLQYRRWQGLLMKNSGYELESSWGGLRLSMSGAQYQAADAGEMAQRRVYDFDHFGRSWRRRPSTGYVRGSDPGDRLWLGFGGGQLVFPPRDGYGARYLRWVVLPHAAVVLVLACLPFAWWRRSRACRRREWRQRRGLCLICGYDLRASTDRCPECGTPVPCGTICQGTV